ncbi:MAG: flagellum-specific ATP synthase [Myxococcota bacterium]|jgi:flagellum-specific ATP synthase
MLLPMKQLEAMVRRSPVYRVSGRVTRVSGLLVEGSLPGARLGMVCRLKLPGMRLDEAVPAEVVALGHDRTVSLMPLGGVTGIHAGAEIHTTNEEPSVVVGRGLLGRVLDGWGTPIDGKGSVTSSANPVRYLLDPPPMNPLERGDVDAPLSVGVRSIDALLTCGRGQRMAILAGAGVGKSTLLGMMCRNTDADVTVMALVGERSREVKRFVEHDLGPEGLKRGVVVAAVSDQAPALRVRAARVATSIAEYFRDQGKRVLLLVDSLSRVAMAQRELGLAVGEPPATRGYPPSSFAIIPRLLERAGPGTNGGSITAFYTTLLEGDDLGDPIGDHVRATTDGHIVLSRRMADRGQFPAVDVLKSTSRVMGDIAQPDHAEAARTIRQLMADYDDVEELVTLGAYKLGTQAKYDRALTAAPDIARWRAQRVEEDADMDESIAGLMGLAAKHGGNG